MSTLVSRLLVLLSCRMRAWESNELTNIPTALTDMAIEYYGQRAANPRGTLLITEATFISEAAGG